MSNSQIVYKIPAPRIGVYFTAGKKCSQGESYKEIIFSPQYHLKNHIVI